MLEEGGLLGEEGFEVLLAIGEILDIAAEELGFGELAAERFVVELEVFRLAPGFVAMGDEDQAERGKAEAEEESRERG